jgi:hypothetical protein
MKTITHIVLILITLALIYGVYTETGIWTAITVGLICIAMEGAFKLFQPKGKRGTPYTG